MSRFDSIQGAAQVVSITNSLQRNSTEADSRKKKSHSKQNQVRLDVMKDKSFDYGSPFEIAKEGNLDQLKSYCEIFSGMLKECDECQATVLHHAAANNQIAVMQYVIESGIDLNATDKDGNTALHVATQQQHAEAVSLLLSNGINDEILNNEKYAGLHIAARLNDSAIMTSYTENGNINIAVQGYRKRTPLHIIAELDNIEVCKTFNAFLAQDKLEGKMKLCHCATDDDDLTPIHLAARKGSYRVLDYIMTGCKMYGLQPEVILGFLDEEGSTPLHAAIDGGHIKIVEVLLKYGASPVASTSFQIPPFLLACSQGRLEMIEVLLNHAESYDAVLCHDCCGQTCLHRCVQAINSHHIIPYLLSKGAEIDAVDNKRQTALMISVITGSVLAASVLIEKSADITISDNQGSNVLHYAVHYRRNNILKILLMCPQASDLVVSMEKTRESPIHLALSMGISEIAYSLISNCKHNVKSIRDNHCNSYLHLAAQGGDWRATDAILKMPDCHSLINDVNDTGDTPLHLAAFGGHLKCTELLLSHGAMVHKNHRGSTPFMAACYFGHREIAQVLIKAHSFQLKWEADDGSNALHMAARSKSAEMISFCLDIGVPVIHNNDFESFFDLIISQNDSKAAAEVVNHARYQEALDLVSPDHKHPMLSLITNMPEVAKQVLDRSLTKSDNPPNSQEYWEKFDFKYILLRDNHQSIQRPCSSTMEFDSTTINFNINYRKTFRHSEILSSKPVKTSQQETLKVMLAHKRNLLLTHPVTKTFLKTKWRNYGRWIESFTTSLIFFQVLFLLCFTASIPSPVLFQRTNETAPCGNNTFPCPNIGLSANVVRFFALAFAGVNFTFCLLMIIKLHSQLLRDTFSLINTLSVMLSAVFTVYYLLPTRGFNNANWSAGAVAMFFSWFSLILRLQLFDFVGVYIIMFLAITGRVFQVLAIFFLFLIGFALSFYIIAGNLTDYSTIGYSLFINLGHLLGEIEYSGFVSAAVEENLQYDWLAFLFVSTVAILMGIVVMNLLIGLAVGDIEHIRNNAIVSQISVKVDFFSRIESIVPSKLRARLSRESYISFPNQNKGIFRKIVHLLLYHLKGQNFSVGAANDSMQCTSQDVRSKELEILRSKVEELAQVQEKIVETLISMKETQENMIKMLCQDKEFKETDAI